MKEWKILRILPGIRTLRIHAAIETIVDIEILGIEQYRWLYASVFILQTPIGAIVILYSNASVHHIDQELVVDEILRHGEQRVHAHAKETIQRLMLGQAVVEQYVQSMQMTRCTRREHGGLAECTGKTGTRFRVQAKGQITLVDIVLQLCHGAVYLYHLLVVQLGAVAQRHIRRKVIDLRLAIDAAFLVVHAARIALVEATREGRMKE